MPEKTSSFVPLSKPTSALSYPRGEDYNAFYGRSGTTVLPADITRTTCWCFQDVEEPMHTLVAEGASGPLGLAHFLFHRSTAQLGPSCCLQDLFTVEAARGKGVARALTEDVYRRTKAGGSPGGSTGRPMRAMRRR